MQGISFYPACCVVGFAARHPFLLSTSSGFLPLRPDISLAANSFSPFGPPSCSSLTLVRRALLKVNWATPPLRGVTRLVRWEYLGGSIPPKQCS
ncbi:uncharacterized protein LAESUDRAFT_230057 [Laetiporus sulphureus 93-53]|uniref:Uncharacterized protein n=1 Tax=Laetiporus sulphureus 93-53 TaxID=1314785 RepID=A0A165DQQ5_9APHY|nr:uncharacterized protein LAESUDRAFT_230057 [Laetiporus sulphureus 93-53]KZT05417.1 hypothetical protein LAESUDRAFT_230057 [Laetiporus sulphureus 93-53]